MEKKQNMIEFLLENANPSIKRRVKKEILNNLTSEEANDYQKQILQEPIIQRIISLQKENGWIGDEFYHSRDAQANAVKYLAEKAVDKDTPVLKRAMDAFITVPLSDHCYDIISTTDEFKHPCAGANLMRCACIARAGYDDVIDISPQIGLAFDSFKHILEIESVFDILHPEKKRGTVHQVFNDYEKWPCRSHLEILANTQSWRSESNIKILAESIIEMMKTDKPELVSYIPSSQKVAGCVGGVFPAQGLTVKGSGLYPSPIMCPPSDGKEFNGYYHFEYLEWFARCGIITLVPELSKIVNEIADSIDENGICRLPMVAERVFKDWCNFGGLQLEVDWKSKTRKACDITFRALLILHYSGIDF